MKYSLFFLLAASSFAMGAEDFQIAKGNAPDFMLHGGAGANEGRSLTMWQYIPGNVNQSWTERGRGTEYVAYEKLGTGLCLDGGNGGANRQPVTLETCRIRDENQHWKKVSTGNGSYRLEKRNAPGFSIDGNNGGENNQEAYLWASSNTNSNQQWIFQSLDGETPVKPVEPVVPEEHAAQWMSGEFGVSWTINANALGNIENYDVDTMVAQVKTIPGVKYVLYNLSDGAYGDTYIAPHSVLSSLNPGSTPNNDRDLFGELAQAFQDAGIKVIAYMATQGPAMLKHGVNQAHDKVNVNGVVTSQSMENWAAYVESVYGDNTVDTYKKAYAEIIVDEYAKRYGTIVDGWWFDNGSRSMNAPLLREIVTKYNPNTVVTFNGSGQTSNYKSGHPTPVGTASPNSEANIKKLLLPIEETENGYFELDDGSLSLGHMYMPIQARWNGGDIVWTAEEGAEWLKRCTQVGAAWTWSVQSQDHKSRLEPTRVQLMIDIANKLK